MFRVIVAGSRTFNNYDLLNEKLDFFLQNIEDEVRVVCGEAAGADTLGRKYAEEHGLAVDSFPADWKREGRSAGYRRNERMAQNADALVAFWDGMSPGTANMISIAERHRLDVRVVKY